MKYELVPISILRPLEKVFPTHLKNLTRMIYKDGSIKCPILADRKTGTILDGSCRYAFFLKEGFKTVPVRWVDYDDENIRVGTHLMHRHLIEGPTNISKAEVKRRGMQRDLYPPRTTRHFFPFRKTDTIDVPLYQLRKSEKVDVRDLIAKVNIKDEIKHNEGFINEIEQEIDEIIRYLDEARQTKNYLKEQVRLMKVK